MRMLGEGREQGVGRQKQIPFGDDKQKGNSKAIAKSWPGRGDTFPPMSR